MQFALLMKMCSAKLMKRSNSPRRALSLRRIRSTITSMPMTTTIQHLAKLKRGSERVMAELTFRQALHDTLREEMLRDEQVFLLGEEIGIFEGSYKITAGLLAEFGTKRVVDTPICENGFVGMATGAAMLGLRPVVEIMTINFIAMAMDEILNHAAKIHYMFGGQCSVPMVIRTPGGGGQQLSATHSQNLETWFAYIPGIKVVAPSTPADAKGLLRTSIRDNNPVL